MESGAVPFSPYRYMHESAETPAFKELTEKLVRISEEFRRLGREFPDVIAANRARREGKKPRFSKAQQKFLVRADRDAAQALEEMEMRYRTISGERALLEITLHTEKFDYDCWAWLYESNHPDDKPMADRIRSLQRSLIEQMQDYLLTH